MRVSSRSCYSLPILRRVESYFLPYTFYLIKPGLINGDLSDGIGNIKLNTLLTYMIIDDLNDFYFCCVKWLRIVDITLQCIP